MLDSFRVVALALVAAAALAAPAAAGRPQTRAPQTTGPELVFPMRATLTDAGIVLNAPNRIQLDTTILFLVTNRAAKTRWFSVGSRAVGQVRRTHLLRPGRSERFYYTFRLRGKVSYQSGGPSAALRAGTFRVA